jgi:acyl carrier protein
MATDLDQIRQVICRVGGLPAIGPDQDIYDAGFSSVSALQLLMDLEADCLVSIPDEQFTAARTPRELHRLIAALQGGGQLCAST